MNKTHTQTERERQRERERERERETDRERERERERCMPVRVHMCVDTGLCACVYGGWRAAVGVTPWAIHLLF